MTAELPVMLVSGISSRSLTAMTSASTSPFTGGQQVQDWGGRYWSYTIDMALMTGRNGKTLDAFLNSLGGSAGKFVFRDPSIDQVVPGAPVVYGAWQLGSALATTGWPANTLVMEAGDFFSIGEGADIRMYQLSADVVSNASGAATLSFHPPLRGSPANGAALNVNTPGVVLRLTGPAPASIDTAAFYKFSISAREAI